MTEEQNGSRLERINKIISDVPQNTRSMLHKVRHATRRDVSDWLFKGLFALMILVAIAPFFMLIAEIASIGLADLLGTGPGQGIELFTTYPGVGLMGGVLNAIVGTGTLVAIAAAVGIPLSIFGAVYINEYSRPGRMREIVEFAADVLAGIPSIVFGAFGFTFLVFYLNIGMGMVAGGLTLAFMMIPTVMRTTQEALKQVPLSLREASLALGATKWKTTWSITIRAAFPGIITGVLLAIGRVMGETAPLIFTAGNNLGAPTSLVGPGSWVASMPFTIWAYISDPRPYLQMRAHSTALALLLIVLAVDIVANYASRKITRRIV
ncbi:MAG: phosphate ABC transporter permease PstA [Candidatus Thorarchaeota archaeon]|nr:phosphate ABC transporter permease PstA [Candidatus Thorarchaeota archaeon]